MVAKSLDACFEMIKATNAPCKRIYYMIDETKARDEVPPSILENLQALALTYGPSFADYFRFVVSKCDMLSLKKDIFVNTKNNLIAAFREACGVDLVQDPVLYISTSNVEGHNCFRHLFLDVAKPSGEGLLLQQSESSFSRQARTLEQFKARVMPSALKYKVHAGDQWKYRSHDVLQHDYDFSIDKSSILKIGNSTKNAQDETLKYLTFLNSYIDAQDYVLKYEIKDCEDCDCANQARQLFKGLKNVAISDRDLVKGAFETIANLPSCTLASFA